MAPPSKAQQQNDHIMNALETIRQSTEGAVAFQARMEEKMTAFERKLDRVDKAVYGNGELGLGEVVRTLIPRVNAIESTERTCRIHEIADQLNDISTRHADEDKVVEKTEEKKTAGEIETRKFRYGLYTTAFIFALDILARLFKLY